MLRSLTFFARNGMLRPSTSGSSAGTSGGGCSRGPGTAGRPTDRSSSGSDLQIQTGHDASLGFGQFVWIGDGTKIRCHEGRVEIGDKTVMGQECTISAYKRVRIGAECVIADRTMFIDFDHGVVEVERPIRQQGIYMEDVVVGSNVWIGYGACILRGVRSATTP